MLRPYTPVIGSFFKALVLRMERLQSLPRFQTMSLIVTLMAVVLEKCLALPYPKNIWKPPKMDSALRRMHNPGMNLLSTLPAIRFRRSLLPWKISRFLAVWLRYLSIAGRSLEPPIRPGNRYSGQIRGFPVIRGKRLQKFAHILPEPGELRV